MRSKTLFQGVIGCFGFLSLSVPFVVIGFLAADDWGESTCKTVALSTQLYLCIVPIMLACSFALASVRRKPTKLLYAISHLGIPWVLLLYLQGRSECAVSHTTATIVQLVFTAAAVFGATFAAAVDADTPAVPAALTSVATMYYFGAGIAYLFSSDVSTEQCSHLGKLGIMIPLLLVVSTAAIVLSDRVQRRASKKLQGVLSSAWAVAAVAHSVLTHHLHDSPCSDAPEWIYLYMAVYLGWAVLWPLFFFVPIGVFSEFGGLGMSAASLTTLAVGALCIFRGAMYVICSGLFKHRVPACVTCLRALVTIRAACGACRFDTLAGCEALSGTLQATGAVLCAPISVATVYLFITGETYKSSRQEALFVSHLAAAYVSPRQPLVVCVPWTYNVV